MTNSAATNNAANGIRGDASQGTGGVFTSSSNNALFATAASANRFAMVAVSNGGAGTGGVLDRADLRVRVIERRREVAMDPARIVACDHDGRVAVPAQQREVHVLDVGHGNCAIALSGDGVATMVDAAPGATVPRALKYLKITRLAQTIDKLGLDPFEPLA